MPLDDDHWRDAFTYGLGARPDGRRAPFEEIFTESPQPDPHGIKVPKQVWAVHDQTPIQRIRYGVEYLDGTKEEIGTIKPGQYRSQYEVEQAMIVKYAAHGIDVRTMPGWKNNPTAEQARSNEEKIRAATEALRRNRERVQWEDLLHKYAEYLDVDDLIRGGPFGRASGRASTTARPAPPPPPTPERTKAIQKCRSLKRLRDDRAATEGERANAQASMDRIMRKHELAEQDI